MADYTLSVDVTANDHASETFKKIQDNAKNFKSTVENAGQSMQKFGEKTESVGKSLTKSVTAPIVGLGTTTAKLSMNFESSMAKVSTIADTTQIPIGDLRKSILKLSSDTGVAASDIAESVYQAISATANSASNDLKSMVKSIDIVDTGINNLKKVASSGLKAIASAFTAATPNVTAEATTMSLKMADSVHKGFAKVPTYTMTTMTMANAVTLAQFVAINATVSGQMNRMVGTVRTSLNQMKSAFAGTRFKLNTSMALPHFSMSGNFNAQTKAVPKVHVSWYAKAYDEAMMFNTPQVVQANGFGDGPGNEVVSGDRHLVELFKEALGSYGGGDTIIPVYVGQERIDELVVTAKQRKDFRSGGR